MKKIIKVVSICLLSFLPPVKILSSSWPEIQENNDLSQYVQEVEEFISNNEANFSRGGDVRPYYNEIMAKVDYFIEQNIGKKGSYKLSDTSLFLETIQGSDGMGLTFQGLAKEALSRGLPGVAKPYLLREDDRKKGAKSRFFQSLARRASLRKLLSLVKTYLLSQVDGERYKSLLGSLHNKMRKVALLGYDLLQEHPGSFNEFFKKLNSYEVYHNVVADTKKDKEDEMNNRRHLKWLHFDIIEKIPPIISRKLFIETLQKATKKLKRQQQGRWLNNENNLNERGEGERLKIVEKAQIFSPNSIIQIIGDQHASGHDTIRFLNWAQESSISPFEENSWKLKTEYENHHWIFAGDITDTGIYGVETLYVILKAFIENPENIHLIRGNHENWSTNMEYGFTQEIEQKYGYIDDHIEEAIKQLYFHSPVALWAGFEKEKDDVFEWTLICHGGIHEEDEQILDLLEDCVQRKSKTMYKLVTVKKSDNGYQWTDFSSGSGKGLSGRGEGLYIYGVDYVTNYLARVISNETHRVVRIIRAHQHTTSFTDFMPNIIKNRGMHFLYGPEGNIVVVTLSVMPCNGFGFPKKVYDYPGVIYLTAAVLTQENLQFYTLPNGHIPQYIKDQHTEILRGSDPSWEAIDPNIEVPTKIFPVDEDPSFENESGSTGPVLPEPSKLERGIQKIESPQNLKIKSASLQEQQKRKGQPIEEGVLDTTESPEIPDTSISEISDEEVSQESIIIRAIKNAWNIVTWPFRMIWEFISR